MKNTTCRGFVAHKPRPGCTNSNKLPLDQFHRLFRYFNVKFSFFGRSFRSCPLNLRPPPFAWITACIRAISSFPSFVLSFRLVFPEDFVEDLLFGQNTVEYHCGDIFSLVPLIQEALYNFFFLVEFRIFEITSKRLEKFLSL